MLTGWRMQLERLKLTFRHPLRPYWSWQAYLYGYNRFTKDIEVCEMLIQRNTWFAPGVTIKTNQVTIDSDVRLMLFGATVKFKEQK
jgi:hypothetical protein